MKEIITESGTRLQEILQKAGMRQADLVRKTNLRQDVISRIVNGRFVPTSEEKLTIAGALGKPVEEVFPQG